MTIILTKKTDNFNYDKIKFYMKFNKRQCQSCLKKTLSDQDIFSSPSAEKIELEDLWDLGKAPWKNWN
jgi:hypothetical protein